MGVEVNQEKIRKFFPEDEAYEIINLAIQDHPGSMGWAALRLDAYKDKYTNKEPDFEPGGTLARGMKLAGAVIMFTGVYAKDAVGVVSGMSLFGGAWAGQEVIRQKLNNKYILVSKIRSAMLADYSGRVRRRAAAYDGSETDEI